jgi:DNA (cytosine-5)-methyltransferase 1
MCNLPELIKSEKILSPDVLCGGTPCQAFSLAGWKQGLDDSRGQLTLKFIEIADAIDDKRKNQGKEPSIILWENVEGVLKDKTNAFGVFIAGLAGLNKEISIKKWSPAGVLYGTTRNIAWRVLDAKYFGLPQQRKRLFVVATDKKQDPAAILFEKSKYSEKLFNYKQLYTNNIKKQRVALSPIGDNQAQGFVKIKNIQKNKIEVFREYTDCLYTAYGTKWNGNAAAYNGSLYISQNDRVRRFTPMECEKLMGFPENYTNIPKNRDTNRYQSLGNSWAIPVISWIGKSIIDNKNTLLEKIKIQPVLSNEQFELIQFNDDFIQVDADNYINTSLTSNNPIKGDLFSVIQISAREKFYLSTKGSEGILRRKNERGIKMNDRLELLFTINGGANAEEYKGKTHNGTVENKNPKNNQKTPYL